MTISQNLADILARIAAARKAAIAPAPQTRLVAVSKTVPETGIREALTAGQRLFGENRVQEASHWRARFPHWIITSSAHSLRALMAAHLLDAIFLSPVFATASHKHGRPLTPLRAAFIAARAPVPVYALGGITGRNAALLAPAFSGIAAIGSLL